MAIVIPITTEWRPGGLQKAQAEISQSEGKFAKFGAGVKAAAVPAAAALGALGLAAYDFAKAAVEDQKSAALLADALKKNTGATDANVASVEDWISAQGRALGVADDQLRPALSTLARATGDVGKAQELAALSMDAAAATGKPLESVAAAMAKAYAGNTSALGRLVPGLDKAAIASGDFSKVQKELADKVGGSAAAAADTAAGKMDRLKLGLDEAKESIGAALLPIIERLLPVLLRMGQFIQNNSGLIAGIAAVVGVFAAAILAVNGALIAYSATTKAYRTAVMLARTAQVGFNIAMMTNPIGLLVAAIAVVVAAVVLFFTKTELGRKIIKAAWDGIKRAMQAVVEWFKNTAWPALKAVIGFIGDYYKALWSTVKAVWSGIVSAVKGGIDKVKEWIEKGKGFISALGEAFGRVRDVIAGVWDGIVDKISNAVNTVKDLLSKIPGVGRVIDALTGRGYAYPAEGLTRGAVPEAFGRSIIRTGPRAAGGGSVTINVQGALLDPEGTARAIERVLRDTGRIRGYGY